MIQGIGKKAAKRLLSVVLSFAMTVSGIMPVLAAENEEAPDLNPFVVVSEAVADGDVMNLTEEGSLDWVHIGYREGRMVNRKKNVSEIIQFEELAETEVKSQNGWLLKYTWKDGTPKGSESNSSRAGTFVYKDGDESSVGIPIEDGDVYKVTLPAANETRMLTFASGVWLASEMIEIYVNGGTTPFYTTMLESREIPTTKKYTLVIRENNSVEIRAKLTEKNRQNGSCSIGGIALKRVSPLPSYEMKLKQMLADAKKLDLEGYDAFYVNRLETEIAYAERLIESGGATDNEYYYAYIFLSKAYEGCTKSVLNSHYMYEIRGKLVSSFGWEGDRHAPIAYIDGGYNLRDNGNITVSFGVNSFHGKIKWYNAEGYLPCFISEYTKDNVDYKIENFANKHTVDGNDYEIAYSRMTVTNNTEEERELPEVSEQLIALNDAAKTAEKIAAGNTVVREYAIGADRFGGEYAYPEDAEIEKLGGFEENYNAMKNYWDARLAPLSEIVSLPNEELINAYKAEFIYTMIIRDDMEGQKRLHVGENGYDEMFDHDTIGIVSSLLTIGDLTYAKEYLATLPAQLQYEDAKWKYSWPYALYLQKTDDLEFIAERFEEIKKNTHFIEEDREADAGNIMGQTNAVDSWGYWLVDNWAALAGLSTYQYLCERLNKEMPGELYQTESDWAKNLYADLLNCVETKQREIREANDYPYLSIDMTTTTENSARGDVRDGNWASMFLFGRWAWDGYLFGADQENSEMIGLIDDTYQHGFERREEVGAAIYNFGGYPSGYYSSGYNAGYGSSALRGERYREAGIRAYEYMIEHTMSGPFGWWEGIGYPSDSSPWEADHASGGGGSCQHTWGQSTARKVLFDALIAEKIGEKVIIGRGIPAEWIADGQIPVEMKDYIVEGAKKIGYKMTTKGTQVEVEFTGEEPAVPYSIELIALKDNIGKVTVDGAVQTDNIDRTAGTILVPAAAKKVVVTMGDPIVTPDKSELETAIQKAEAKDLTGYTEASANAYKAAIQDAKAVFEDEDATEKDITDAIAALTKAEEDLETEQPPAPVKPDKSELETAIQKAEAKDLTGYTEASANAYKAAIQDAKAVLEDEDATEKDITDVIAALTKAEEDLETEQPPAPVKPDKSELETAIQKAEAKDLTGYTEASVNAYKAAIQDAKAVLEDEDATEKDITDAIAALTKAEEDLETEQPPAPVKPDKSELETAIRKAEAKDLTGYTEASANAYKAAIQDAKAVLEDEDATEKDITDAIAALTKAEEDLETEQPPAPVKPDKSELETAIRKAEAKDLTGYTEASANAYKAAIQDAKAVLEDEDATEKDITDVIAALTKVEEDLETEQPPAPVKPDKSELETAIQKAEAKDLTGYTEASVNAYKAAIQDAKAVLEDENATEKDITDVIAALTKAEEDLETEQSPAPVKPDKSELETAIQKAEAKDLTGYTEASANAYKAAIQDAKAVLEDEDATEKDITDVIAALTKAEEDLETEQPPVPVKPDKSELETAIQKAEAKDLTGYTEASANAYKAAIQDAKAVLEDEDATEKDITDAIAALTKAEEDLKTPDRPVNPEQPKQETVDKANQAVKDAETEDLSGYTAESVKTYQDAVQAVKDVLAKEDATETELQDALIRLAGAKAGLTAADPDPGKPDEPQQPVNPNQPSKETLAQADKELKDADAVNLSGYTEESVKAYQAAVQAVKDVLAKKDATEAEVKAALAALAKAKEGLKAKEEGGANQTIKVSSIKLSAASKKIAAGKKVAIKAAVSPATASNKAVTFSTSNKKYATVNAKGVVTTKKAGAGKTVTITARAKDGSGKSASIKIKIMKGVVKKIKLKAAKTVKAGKKVTVKATVTASKKANTALEYSVNNKKYASVNKKGVVTTKKAGKGKTVTITAKSTDGSNKKATVKIKIK